MNPNNQPTKAKNRLENRYVDSEGSTFGTATLGGSQCVVSIAPSHGAMIRSLHGGSKLANGEPHKVRKAYGESWCNRTATGSKILKEGLSGKAHRPDAEAVSQHSKRFDAVKTLTSKAVKVVRKTEDFAGKVVGLDIGAALRGDAFIRNKKRRRTQSECVAIFVPVNALGYIDARMCQIRSSAALAAAQILEDSGQPVEIYGLAWSANVNHGYDALSVVKVKSASEPFNLGMAASALSAWSWRTVVFGFRELGFANALSIRMNDGSGSTKVPTAKFCADLSRILGCQKFATVAHVPTVSGYNRRTVQKEIETVTAALMDALKNIQSNDDA